MAHVENKLQTDDVRIGFGIGGQEGALFTAGAERVFLWPKERDLVLGTRGAAVRAGDVILMVQPDAIPLRDLREVIAGAGGDVSLQVIGNDPTRDLAAFQAQRPTLVDVPMRARTGRPSSIEYTQAQAEAIIRLWHEVPRRKPAEVTALAEAILGLDAGSLKRHWVRDLVIKFVGTARRDPPDDWAWISTEKNQEAD